MELIDAKIWISKNASLCQVFANRITIVKISSLHGVIRGSYTYLLLYNVFQVIEHAHTHDEVNMCSYVATIIYQLSNSTTYESSLLHSHSNFFFDIPLLLASNACAYART